MPSNIQLLPNSLTLDLDLMMLIKSWVLVVRCWDLDFEAGMAVMLNSGVWIFQPGGRPFGRP